MGDSVVNLDSLQEKILSLNEIQILGLIDRLERVLGLPLGSFVAGAGGSAVQEGDGASSAVESKTEFDVVLTEIDSAKKIAVIKIVKDLNPDLGLTGARDLVNSLPKTLVSKVSKDDAESIKEKLLAAGAIKVVIE